MLLRIIVRLINLVFGVNPVVQCMFIGLLAIGLWALIMGGVVRG